MSLPGGKERKAFLLRVSPALWAELEAWSQAEFRSVNSQIEFLLDAAVKQRRGNSGGAKEAKGTKGP